MTESEGRAFRRILVALDGAGLAEAAIPVVAALAAPGAEVEIVTVHDLDRDERTQEEADALVLRAVEALAAMGVGVHGQTLAIVRGDVARTLVQEARQRDVDLIALGSHGRSDLGGILLGSVGHRVAAGLDCPVLLVRGELRERPESGRAAQLQRLLLAVDRHESSASAVEAAANAARLHGAEVVVLYVPSYLEPVEEAEGFTARIVSHLRGEGVQASAATLADVGNIPLRIAQVADSTDADLIVIGSRRRTSARSLLIGSVAHELLRHTARPVLVAERPD